MVSRGQSGQLVESKIPNSVHICECDVCSSTVDNVLYELEVGFISVLCILVQKLSINMDTYFSHFEIGRDIIVRFEEDFIRYY